MTFFYPIFDRITFHISLFRPSDLDHNFKESRLTPRAPRVSTHHRYNCRVVRARPRPRAHRASAIAGRHIVSSHLPAPMSLCPVRSLVRSPSIELSVRASRLCASASPGREPSLAGGASPCRLLCACALCLSPSIGPTKYSAHHDSNKTTLAALTSSPSSVLNTICSSAYTGLLVLPASSSSMSSTRRRGRLLAFLLKLSTSE